MKEEAKFQIRGSVVRAYDKAIGKWQVVCLQLKVSGGKEDAADDELEVNVWQDELKDVARSCQGRQALVLGRLRCKRNQHGFLNPTLSADAILVEPDTRRAYGAAAPAPTAHERSKANGFTPAEIHADMADDDIPF